MATARTSAAATAEQSTAIPTRGASPAFCAAVSAITLEPNPAVGVATAAAVPSPASPAEEVKAAAFARGLQLPRPVVGGKPARLAVTSGLSDGASLTAGTDIDRQGLARLDHERRA
ncbi:MAG TPA: hypothetical protein VNB06_03125 [Thermoanaerobaculia bacterium]|nr:hypothetical protein [Thermoanaerobaculia bacterium]